jgi:hypothetical protein
MTTIDIDILEPPENLLHDVGVAIAEQLTHTWEACVLFSCVSRYEGSWRSVLSDKPVTLRFIGATCIPTVVHGTYNGGGCPGEDAPHHRCSRACQEVTIDFKAELVGVHYEQNGWTAQYSVK